MTPVESLRQVFSVADLTKNIRFILEENFSNVWVEGEISNFKYHSSGHRYFSLKDAESQIQCVMFRQEGHQLDFEMKEGLKIVCFGRVSVYPVRGQYQLYVEKAEPKGIGALQLKFEALKEKLRLEGLFSEEHKKQIPYMPKTIGIITSRDGAALRDILNILNRRFQNAEVLIYPVPVQGLTAAPAIAEAIEDFNRLNNVQVLIVTRGGGSLEDLWAFNEEITARAIFDSHIPVISAVGHEIDFTIADFVADLRAPTPSAAAEMVLPLKQDLKERITELKTRAAQAVKNLLDDCQDRLSQLISLRAFRDPLNIFDIQSQRLDELQKQLSGLLESWVSLQKERLSGLCGKLDALGPLATLRRGFSVTLQWPEGNILKSAASLKRGDKIKTQLAKGFMISQVEEVQ